MKKQSFLLLFLFLCAFSLSGMAKEQTAALDTIWFENFSGCYDVPETGFNATYTYSNKGGQIGVQHNCKAGGADAEIMIGKQKVFTAHIFLYGAKGDLTLSFKASSTSNLTVKLNNAKKGLTAEDGKYKINVSDKEAIDLSFEYSGSGYIYLDDFVLTGSAGCRGTNASPGLSFDKSFVSTYLGDDVVLPTLFNPNNLDVSYWSTDKTVAEVNDGKVEVKGIGKARIYAVFHGSSDYAYQAVSYVLGVKRNVPTGEIFYESFDKILAHGGNDGQYISGVVSNDDFDFDNSKSTASGLRLGYKCVYFNNEGANFVIGPFNDFVSGKNYILTFRMAGLESGNLSDAVVTVNNGNTTGGNCTLKNAAWQTYSIPLGEINSNTTITFTGRYFFLDDISIAPAQSVDVAVGEYKFATLYYSDRALTVPTGVLAYTMTVSNGEAVPSKRYEAGSTIPKGEAVVLSADAGTYTFNVSSDSPTLDAKNLLKGTDEDAITTGGDVYYAFGVDPDSKAVGFYYGAAGGDAFTNSAHKAYLALSNTGNSNSSKNLVKGFAINLDKTPTAVSTLRVAETAVQPVYNLSGQRVGKGYKGLVISNGRKLLRK